MVLPAAWLSAVNEMKKNFSLFLENSMQTSFWLANSFNEKAR